MSISTATLSRSRVYPDWAFSVNNPPMVGSGNEAVTTTTVIQPEGPVKVKKAEPKMETTLKVEHPEAGGAIAEGAGQTMVIVEESRHNGYDRAVRLPSQEE